MDNLQNSYEKCQGDLQQARAEIARLQRELAEAQKLVGAHSMVTLQGIPETELFRSLINSLPDFIYVKDAESRFIIANKALADLVGTEPEKMIGKTDFEFFPRQDAQEFYEDEQRLIKSGKAIIRQEEHNQDLNGGDRWTVTTKVPFTNADGKVIGIIGLGQSITDRKQMEMVFQRETALLRGLIDSVPDLIFYKDLNGVYLGCNKAFAEFAGTQEQDLIGKTDYDLFPQDVAEFFRQQDSQMIAERATRSNEEWVTYPDGRQVLLDTLKTPFYSSDGSVFGLIGISRNITETHRMENDLRSTEQLYRQILDSITDMILVKGPKSHIVWANKAFREAYGMDNDQLKDMIDSPIVEPDLTQKYIQDDEWVFVNGKTLFINEEPVVRYDGAVIPVQTVKSPIFNENGQVVMTVGASRDITEAKRIADSLRSSQVKLAEALEVAHMVYWDFDVANGMFNFNDDFYKSLGTTAEEEGGYQMPAPVYAQKYVHPDDGAVVGRSIGEALATSDPNFATEILSRVIRKDGTHRTVVVRVRIEKDAEGKTIRILGTNQDVTEQKALEETVIEDRAKLAEALEAARMAYWDFDVASGMFTFNDNFYKSLGTTAVEEGGYQMPAMVYAQKYVHPDDADTVGRSIGAALETTDLNFTLETSARVIRKDGAVRMVAVRFQIEKDAEGKTIRLFGANQDVTEQKALEEAIVKRATEMATVSEVATMVATVQDPDAMLQTVVDLTKEAFGLYHAHIYMLNEAGDTLVLTKGAGEVGRKMVAEERQIALAAEKSLVARAARTHQGVIVNDVNQDPDFLPHPLLPETRSEMAIPVLLGDQLLGVLDVQSRVVNRFTQDDIQVKTTMAAQVAVALQNARQYSQLRASEKMIRTVMDSTPDWIFIKDQNHRYHLANQGYANSLHIPVEDFIGKTDLDLGFPEELVKGNPEKGIIGFWPADREVMDGGQTKVIPYDIVQIDGKPRIFNTIKNPLRDENNNVWGLLAFGRDVTEREALLAESAALYEATSKMASAHSYEEVLKAVVDGSFLKEYDTSTLFFFDRPWKGEDRPSTFTCVAAVGNVKKDHYLMPVGVPIPLDKLPNFQRLATSPYYIMEDVRSFDTDEGTRKLLLQANLLSTMTVRLMVNDEWIGCIGGGCSSPRMVTEAEIRRMTNLAAQASTVAQNLRLLDRVQSALNESAGLYRREQTLREITAMVRNSMDPETIMRTAVRELGNALGRPAFIRMGSAEQLVQKPDQTAKDSENGNGSSPMNAEGGR